VTLQMIIQNNWEKPMKSKLVLLIGLIAIVSCPSPASADNLRDMLFRNCVPNCIAARQCDDYCRKQIPCTQPTCNRQCDDYCPKRIPCTQPTCNRQCNDYCPKRLPRVCCPKCGPATSCQTCRNPSIGKPAAALAERIVFLIVDPVGEAKATGAGAAKRVDRR